MYRTMRAHANINTGQPVHRTESTKNSESPVKLSEYLFSNQQQYNQLFHD